MKIILFLVILFLNSTLTALAQYSSPESVTYDSTGRRYLVSNTSSQKIVQRDLYGIVSDFVTVGGGIHGITVHNGKVYICNQTRVKGYDLVTATEVFNVTISGSSFLNDLAIDANGIMYVSDFSARRIYKVITSTNEYWTYVTNTTNTPNGVYVDAPRNRLLICCWGSNAPIRKVDFADSSISTLVSTGYGNLDGISLDRNNNVYVSAWSAQSVIKYDINFANAPVVVTGSLSNPADIFVNKASDTLAIPNAGNNTVTFFHLDNPTSVNPNFTETPEHFTLHQNFPNPFNPATRIRFELNKSEKIKLSIIDVNGIEKALLLNDHFLDAGSHAVEFNGKDFPSGIYFYRLESSGISQTRSMILLK